MRCKKIIFHLAKHDKNTDFKLVAQKFHVIEEIVTILGKVAELTKNIQKTIFTLSDFYRGWILLKLKLQLTEAPETNLVANLLSAMNNRHASLFGNPAMLAAVYLDNRVRINLNDQEVMLAKETLIKLWKRMQDRHVAEQQTQAIQALSVDDDSLLDAFFAEKENVATQNNIIQNHNANTVPNYNTDSDSILLAFGELDKETRQNTPVLDYWEQNKTKYPEIYELAVVLNGIPPSQSTIERTFSTISNIFNNKRCNLAQDLLEAILLVCINKNITEEIFKHDINLFEKKK